MIVDDFSKPIKISFDLAFQDTSKYSIRIEQLPCDSDDLAPPGCLTYNTELSGKFSSYNYAGGNGEMINNQQYSHCIKHQEGFCDVALTANVFDLGYENDVGDSMTIGNTVLTGSEFGSNNMLTCEYHSIIGIKQEEYSIIQTFN